MGDKMLVSLFGSITWGPYLSMVPYTFPNTTKHQPKLRRESLPSKQFNKYILLITPWLFHCGIKVSPYICVMILHDTKTLSKIIRKCIGKKWFTSKRGQVEYKYRFVSLCDADGWNDRLYTIKVNIEIEVTKSPYLHRSWYPSIESRENKSIRSDFYYQDNNELNSLLKLFSCDPQRLVIKSIKRKKWRYTPIPQPIP